jgi:spermidine synthase
MFRIGHKLSRSVHRKFSGDSSVDVSESDGIRYLHLGSDTVQSAMRVKDPTALELRYSRGVMMAPLPNTCTVICRTCVSAWSRSTRR